MITVDTKLKVQLVDGTFTPLETNDVINSLIDKKINFHKIHRLSMVEGDETCDTSYDNGRIGQLLKEKENIKAIYQEAKALGKQVRINGVLEVEIID